jgi:hypothetical protein
VSARSSACSISSSRNSRTSRETASSERPVVVAISVCVNPSTSICAIGWVSAGSVLKSTTSKIRSNAEVLAARVAGVSAGGDVVGVRDPVLPVASEHPRRSPLVDEPGSELLVEPGAEDDAGFLIEAFS